MIGREYVDLHPNTKRELFAANQEVQDKYGGIYEVVPKKKTFVRKSTLVELSETEKFAEELGGFVMPIFEKSRTVDSRFVEIQKADYARLMFLATFMTHETGKLVCDNAVPFNRDIMQKEIGLSRSRFSEFWNRVFSDGALYESNGYIYMNHELFYKGSLKGGPKGIKSFGRTKMYRNPIRELYRKYGSGKSVVHLSLVYAILPFLNKHTNVLAWNPEESDGSLVRPITVDKLAIAMGYDNSKSLKTAMNKVWLGNDPVFTFNDNPYDRRTKRIVVNPRVFFNASKSELNAIMVFFNN